MNKWVCDPIILPDGYTWQDLEDAKLSAKWRKVVTNEDRMKRTDLTDKCGSCKYYKPYVGKQGGTSRGECAIGTCPTYRTRRKCKKYEVKQ